MRMSMPRNIMSMTSMRRTIQRMEQLGKPVAGSNSERLKAKRRRQMVDGKLGMEALELALRIIAHNMNMANEPLDTDPEFSMEHYYIEMYIQGKEQTPNVEYNNRLEPTK